MTHYLITGGAGFIGSHLCEYLLARGHQVTAFDNLSTGRIENIEHLAYDKNFQIVVGNILHGIHAVAEECDVIIHLAAMVGATLVTEQPLLTLRINVRGTERVLEAARDYDAKVLIASSSEVYGKSEKVPFREDDDVCLGPATQPRWGYAASKLVDEFTALAYRSEYGLRTVIFRLFNTVGPRQVGTYGMVMPRFIQAALANEPLTVYGDGNQTRCFCHIEDVVRAIAGLAQEPMAMGEIFNIGSTEETSILALAQRVIALTNSQSEIVFAPGRAGDAQRRVPDIGRIQRLLDWQPEHSLDQIIRCMSRRGIPRL